MTGRWEWPPPSVLAAAGLLAAPPLGLTAGALVTSFWPAVCFPLVWLTLSVGPVWQFVRGRPSGFGGAVGLVALAGLVVAGGVAVAAAAGAGWKTLLAAGSPAGWLACVAAFLWWPATRRWCGRLPPADPEDD